MNEAVYFRLRKVFAITLTIVIACSVLIVGWMILPSHAIFWVGSWITLCFLVAVVVGPLIWGMWVDKSRS
jgi:hypothetical protein